MNSQDKLHKIIKDAAKQNELKPFEAQEAVWDKIEAKLDRKKRWAIPIWQQWTVAASVALLIGVGTYSFWLNQGVSGEETAMDAPQEVAQPQEEKEERNDILEGETTGSEDELKPTEPNLVVSPAPLPNVEPKTDKNKPNPISQGVDVTQAKGDFLQAEEISTGYGNNEQEEGGAVEVLDKVDPEFDLIAKVQAAPAISPTPVTQTLQGKVAASPILEKKQSASQGRVVIDENAKPLAQEVPNASFDQVLQGQAAGISIQQSTNTARDLSSVRIRGVGSVSGNTEPTYILDGIEITKEEFQNLNPQLFEVAAVLKDAASTSIYGSRGTNGVVLLKSKDFDTNNAIAETSYSDSLSPKEKRKLKRQQKKEAKQSKEESNETSIEVIELPKIEVSQEDYESFVENPFESPQNSPLSTFSIDVDNASYSNIRRFINYGQTVPKDAIRIEEMINYFDYDYPQPTGEDPLSINTEYSDAPWNENHKLLKIGLQGKDIPKEDLPPSNLVFLIDVSGSMSAQNKLPLLKSSMKLLVDELREQDRVAIVVYAGAAGLVLEPTSGENKQDILDALDRLNAGGSTAGGEGIELAYATAQEYFIEGGNNRVILATDGDFNVGASSNSDMETLIEQKRETGIFLTCLGYGMGNYKDSKMEILANKGNGNYAYIDNMQEANKFLVEEFTGSLFTIAKDVKLQIEFNPKHVQSYRLIGYENRKLRPEDFTNDAIDAGDLGAGHTVTALYEIIPTGVESEFFSESPELKYSKQELTGKSNELATIKFRYKQPDEDVSKELVQVVKNNSEKLNKASEDFRFATAVAWFGLKLRDSKLVNNKSSQDIQILAKQGKGEDESGYRSEFIRLVDAVK